MQHVNGRERDGATWVGHAHRTLGSWSLPSEPSGIWPRSKTPQEWRDTQKILTKATFWGQEDASWESGAACPSWGSVLKGLRGPAGGLCGFWMLPSAKTMSPCQTLGRKYTRKYTPTPSHLKQYQQNYGIKTTFKGVHTCCWYRGEEVCCQYQV